MSKKTTKVNHRLVIFPPHPGDFGLVHMGGVTREESETLRILEQMRADVIRHVDDVRQQNVSIEFDIKTTCEHCGSVWTEGDSPHNGGCCKKDEAVMLSEDAVTQ